MSFPIVLKFRPIWITMICECFQLKLHWNINEHESALIKVLNHLETWIRDTTKLLFWILNNNNFWIILNIESIAINSKFPIWTDLKINPTNFVGFIPREDYDGKVSTYKWETRFDFFSNAFCSG